MPEIGPPALQNHWVSLCLASLPGRVATADRGARRLFEQQEKGLRRSECLLPPREVRYEQESRMDADRSGGRMGRGCSG